MKVVLAAVCIAAAGLFLVKDYQKITLRAHERNCSVAVENYLLSRGCDRVRQIFSSDYDIYFRRLPPYIPYINGGAPKLGTYGCIEEYPEFPVHSPAAFAAACRQRGVRFVVLTPQSSLLSPALGALYQTGRAEEFTFNKQVGRFRIFETSQALQQ